MPHRSTPLVERRPRPLAGPHVGAWRQPDLDVGVIYTHERAWIGPLLDSIAASAPSLRLRLLLVDNASPEGVDEFRRLVSHTVVLRNDRRRGYAANLNRILEQSTARHVLLLNTDMLFEPAEEPLARLVAWLDAQPQVGVAGCQLYHADGQFAHPARRFPTPTMIVARRLPWLMPDSTAADDYLHAHRSADDSFDCDWLSGCLLAIRRECHQEVGGFDERYIKYFEDVDYCARAWQAGWRVSYFGGTYAYHFEQRASTHIFSQDSWLHLRAYARWLWKRHGPASRGVRHRQASATARRQMPSEPHPSGAHRDNIQLAPPCDSR